MMLRLWQGRIWAGRIADFLSLLSSRAMQEYPQTPGFLGVYAFQRREAAAVEVLLASFWESPDAIQKYAQADHERARHSPEHKDMIIDPGPRAQHYEVAHLHLNSEATRAGGIPADSGSGVIMRKWRGRVLAENASAYLDFMRHRGFKDYAATPGNLGVYGLQRTTDGVTEFLLFTLWESVAAIKRFAGEDFEKAQYYPDSKDFLLEFERHVTHYEVVLAQPHARQTAAPQVIL
ncbi:MAG TPA: antibiotic biosynthesis monooxygenase [Candidatus Saccharimonadales bacterium]|jgi:heme-degrading monooxygenase HmoA|nr:antibiotic biosynthesis monooxygenase [Candidatus Saccharimonadales bacterium]